MDVKYVTPELSGLPYTCYLYAAMDIYSRYKVGLILPKLDEGGSLLALYHATQQFPFALCYVQTDNGLQFQSRFHAKCSQLGLGASPMRMQSSSAASEPMKRSASSVWTVLQKTTCNSIPGTSLTYTPTTPSVPIWVSICLPLRRLLACT